MPQPTTDRNLLFGILALQMDFISRDELIAAMQAWVLDKAKPLGQILTEHGVLAAERRALLDALVREHLKQHGDDPQHSLAAARSGRVVWDDLRRISDADVQASLVSVGAETQVEERNGAPPAPRDGARYRKLRLHAQGGLGEVFVAQDAELHREVALKEIRADRADDPPSRSRFVLEAEITGGLEHPGIVPVYGLGTYPDGRPFYAMRFIRGDSLKAEIEHFHAAEGPERDPGERALALRQLLGRFVAVCNAVAYAHSRGVLHRDLKPANIMLGPYGETLVVDWGLARAGIGSRGMGDRTPELTAEPSLRPSSGSGGHATQAGAALGTPMYMSPEQAEGRLDDLGPASDVYSLGATLYVLLTGRRPFEGASSDEVLAQVRRGRFPPPRRAKAGTPRALDAVCRKAMALRPEDRYANALDLAADVEHWLADEPVAAWREPLTVRAGRWARRHRTALVAAAVFLVSAVVALGASTALVWREQRQTAAQKQVAEDNYELARELSFDGASLVQAAEAQFAAVPSLHLPRKRFLDTASKAFRQYLGQRPGDPELRQKTADVYRFTANVHRLTNETSQAERLYQDALGLVRGLVEQFPDESRYREKLSETLRDHASLQSNEGRLRQATATVEQAVELAEELRRQDPAQPNYQRTLAAALLNLARLQHARGLNAESRQTAGRSAELFRGLTALPRDRRYAYDPLLLGAALNLVAIAEREAGDFRAARRDHQEAVNLLEALRRDPPSGLNPLDAAHFLAALRLEQCRTWMAAHEEEGKAEQNLSSVIEQWQRLAKDFSGIPMYRESQAVALRLRGELRTGAGRPDDARADLEASRELLEARVKEAPRAPEPRGDLGRTYAALARLAAKTGDRAAAADWLGKAAAALEAALLQSPDDARDRRSLEEVRKARAAK